MSAVPSVHDNRILRYSVEADAKRIVFETEYGEGNHREFADVVFDDVLAYHFENDLFGTIIFDIDEVDIARLLDDNASRFEQGWRYGWPRGWEKQQETLVGYVKRLGMRAFELSSSYGMTGWVIAREMTKVTNESTEVPPRGR